MLNQPRFLQSVNWIDHTLLTERREKYEESFLKRKSLSFQSGVFQLLPSDFHLNHHWRRCRPHAGAELRKGRRFWSLPLGLWIQVTQSKNKSILDWMDPPGHVAKVMTVFPMYGFDARYFIYVIAFQHPHKVGILLALP